MQNKTDSFLLFFIDIEADITLSEIPQPKNVSAGKLVMFTCATPETGLTTFTLTPEITVGNTIEIVLPNGDRQLILSFIAPSEYQMLTISCVATRLMGMMDFNSSTAVLMIQGETVFKLCMNSRQCHVGSHVVSFVWFICIHTSLHKKISQKKSWDESMNTLVGKAHDQGMPYS